MLTIIRPIHSNHVVITLIKRHRPTVMNFRSTWMDEPSKHCTAHIASFLFIVICICQQAHQREKNKPTRNKLPRPKRCIKKLRLCKLLRASAQIIFDSSFKRKHLQRKWPLVVFKKTQKLNCSQGKLERCVIKPRRAQWAFAPSNNGLHINWPTTNFTPVQCIVNIKQQLPIRNREHAGSFTCCRHPWWVFWIKFQTKKQQQSPSQTNVK